MMSVEAWLVLGWPTPSSSSASMAACRLSSIESMSLASFGFEMSCSFHPAPWSVAAAVE